MVNKVILVGNVGGDPEIKYFDNDSAVANFSVATTERAFKTRDGKDVPERTEWHRVVAWRGLAKLAENYIKKGTQVYVEGKIRTRSYEDANGVTKYTTEIYADTINLLGRRPESSEMPSAPHIQQQTQQVPNESISAPTQDEPEDDLPF